MSTFKDITREDIRGTFLNPDEFGETHTVNGRENTNIILDDVELLNREKYQKELKNDGTSRKKMLFYVKASDFGRLPSFGTQITIDNKRFIVENATNEHGVYAITIRATRQ